MENNYIDFLETKRRGFKNQGKEIQINQINSILFGFQKDLVKWAVKKGKCAIFADTGLGKTFMQLEWARLIGEKSLIIAPLSVARQTVKEAVKICIDVNFCRSQEETKKGINITNYEMIEHFTDDFDAIVLDESSILKSITSKTKSKLIETFRNIDYKLCCTATPAPNDNAEIANHAEFLGIMKRVDMLSTFFVHDGGWRLKKHAKTPFFEWMASWGMSIKKPSNLGYSDEGYNLPALNVIPEFVDTDYKSEGTLFGTKLKGITDRSKVRKATVKERVKRAVEIVNKSDEQWIIWCALNDEANLVKKQLKNAVNVQGSDSTDKKIKSIEDFQDGKIKVLITKPKIAGFGMNFQNAHNMIFLGINDSFESYYQCVRRCYRFGQTKPVNVYIVLSTAEQDILNNIQRKEQEAKMMSDNLIKNVQKYEIEEIKENKHDFKYKKETVKTDKYTLMLGDSVERIKEILDESVGLSVFSPPFMSLYAYSPTERDLGNSSDESEFFKHFDFIIKDLLRITKTGRNAAVHVAQVPAMQVRDDYIGLKDFRGKTIEAFQNAGWHFYGECAIDKNPQAQAIRTHAKGLTFTQLRKDSAWSRPALADFMLIFRKPGENKIPVKTDITNEQWIEWARPIWTGISETDTLQFTHAKGNDDERHICPLQLGTIERAIRLWSNKGDLVFSPFTGIGSEGYQAIKFGRKFIGIELKESYFKVAKKNLDEASGETQKTLF